MRSALAVLTPPGRGGIAVIRCVGPRAAEAIRTCFRPAGRHADLPAPGRLAYGHVTGADGRPLDEVILYRAAPDRFEVNCHGGPAAVRAVRDRLAACGLEEVAADELLALEGASRIERAARRMLREARTPLAARVVVDQLGGALAAEVERVRSALTDGRADEAADRLDALLDRWRTLGRHLERPPRIAVTGRPNVGKSTLVNRLLGADRVITSPEPGTTRDWLDAPASLDGLPAVLVDTAGLRASDDEIERSGVERALAQAEAADLVVYLLDATEGETEEDRASLAALGACALAVWNKADLAKPPSIPSRVPAISALTGEGVPALIEAMLAKLDYRSAPPDTAVPFTSEQAEALASARQALVEANGEAAADRLRPLLA